MILTGDMIGHEIDNDLHANSMRPLHKRLKLVHAMVDINSQIWIYIIIIGDSVGRASLALDDARVLTGNTKLCIIRRCSMTYHTRIPDMGKAHIVYLAQA